MRSGNVSLTSIIFHGNLLKEIGGEKRRGKEEREGREKAMKRRREYKFLLFLQPEILLQTCFRGVMQFKEDTLNFINIKFVQT